MSRQAVKTALEKRTDLLQSRKNLEMSNTNIRYLRNQILPDLNAQVGYGLSGQGGTKLNSGPASRRRCSGRSTKASAR